MTEAKRTRKPSPPRAVPAPVYKKPVVVSAQAKEGLGWLHTAKFLTSASKISQLPAGDMPEIAFVGRSNAGKSSAINTLAQQRQLAFASKTPGRTQLINLFTLGPREALVTSAFENTEAPMAVVEASGLDPSFRILYTNESMGSTTQFSAEQLLGKSLADLEAWTTEFIDMVVGFVSRGALLSSVPMWTRTRQDFQVYLSFYPIRKDDEPITGLKP